MRRARLVVALALSLSFLTGPRGGPLAPPTADASALREVSVGRVSALVPRSWEFQPMEAADDPRAGLLAARSLERWRARERLLLGLEAYWVDATRVGVPSDYYYLAAEGPALARLPAGKSCRRRTLQVLSDRHPEFDRRRASPGEYVATAGGVCRSGKRVTRWASFVAAPGFGPVRRIGIPESGLYFAMVMVPDRPGARERAARLLGRVTFGGTAVEDFLLAAGGPV